MKGQFFLISAVVVIIVLFLVKSSLNLSQIIENKRDLEVSMERKEFLNIKNSLIKTVEYSYNKNLSEKIENYISYVRRRLKTKAVELNGIAIESIFRNVTAYSNTSLNVTIYNFLGETITTLSLNFSYDNSSQSFYYLEDGASIKADFVFNTSSDMNYTLTVSYSTPTESNFYEVVIPVEMEKSKFIGFFDLRVKGLKVENRDKFSKILEII